MSWLANKLYSVLGPREQKSLDNPAAIEKKVVRLQKKAERIGLTKGFTEIAHEDVFYFAAWLNSPENRWAVPNIITEARELDRRRVELIVNGRRLVFERKEVDDLLGRNQIELTLEIEGQIVFGVITTVQSNPYAEWCTSPYVTAFIEGPWVDDILVMVRARDEINRESSERLRKSQAESAKKRFGL